MRRSRPRRSWTSSPRAWTRRRACPLPYRRPSSWVGGRPFAFWRRQVGADFLSVGFSATSGNPLRAAASNVYPGSTGSDPAHQGKAIMLVRTRFAPSPTGYLHIGGVRTALFNYLFARRHGGRFILRIDDTDEQRNVAEALKPILDGFRWLGIDWDEGADVGGAYGPYYQSQRRDRYQAAVETLLEKGLAYHDYATPEELKTERETAEKDKQPYRYSRRWMAETPAQRTALEAQGRKGVVRLKMPREGVCRFHDHIRGDMEVAWEHDQDHVIQIADGSCLHNLANVVAH